MKIAILTIFPEMFASLLSASILGRARAEGLLTVEPVDIRPFSALKHKNTDDYPFGGGAGMVMTPQPIVDAVEAARARGFLGPCLYMFVQMYFPSTYVSVVVNTLLVVTYNMLLLGPASEIPNSQYMVISLTPTLLSVLLFVYMTGMLGKPLGRARLCLLPCTAAADTPGGPPNAPGEHRRRRSARAPLRNCRGWGRNPREAEDGYQPTVDAAGAETFYPRAAGGAGPLPERCARAH